MKTEKRHYKITDQCHECRCKALNKILTDQIQEYIKRIMCHEKMDFTPGMQDSLKFKNQCS